MDVVSKEPAKRLEYKAWETGEVTSWGAIFGKKSGAYEFVKDILYKGEPIDFGWVIRGTDLDKVQTKMLQTLGEVAVKGKKKLHPVLKEALENEDLTEEALDKVIQAVQSGSLLRKAGD